MTTSFAATTAAPVLTVAQNALKAFVGKLWGKNLPQYNRANKPYYCLSVTMEGMPHYVLAMTRQQHSIMRLARMIARSLPEGAVLTASRMSEQDYYYSRRSENIPLS